jgi:hypothetical protein
VSLNDLTYSELAVLAGRLSMIAKKPISLGMAVAISTEIFNVVLNTPGVEEFLEKKFSEGRIMTPEEFDIHWDEFFKVITGEKKKVGKAEVEKTS